MSEIDRKAFVKAEMDRLNAAQGPTPEEIEAKRKRAAEAIEKHDQFFADDFVEQEDGHKVSKYLLSILQRRA